MDDCRFCASSKEIRNHNCIRHSECFTPEGWDPSVCDQCLYQFEKSVTEFKAREEIRNFARKVKASLSPSFAGSTIFKSSEIEKQFNRIWMGKSSTTSFSRYASSSLQDTPKDIMAGDPGHSSLPQCFGKQSYLLDEQNTLQHKLSMKFSPDLISQRPSKQEGRRVAFIESWKLISLANELFGFNGWSNDITSQNIDYVDEVDGCFHVGASACVRVTLKDGSYHEELGYGISEELKSKGISIERAKKEAVSDGLKRSLRNFGNALGNCLADKNYLNWVVSASERQDQSEPSAASSSTVNNAPYSLVSQLVNSNQMNATTVTRIQTATTVAESTLTLPKQQYQPQSFALPRQQQQLLLGLPQQQQLTAARIPQTVHQQQESSRLQQQQVAPQQQHTAVTFSQQLPILQPITLTGGGSSGSPATQQLFFVRPVGQGVTPATAATLATIPTSTFSQLAQQRNNTIHRPMQQINALFKTAAAAAASTTTTTIKNKTTKRTNSLSTSIGLPNTSAIDIQNEFHTPISSNPSQAGDISTVIGSRSNSIHKIPISGQSNGIPNFTQFISNNFHKSYSNKNLRELRPSPWDENLRSIQSKPVVTDAQVISDKLQFPATSEAPQTGKIRVVIPPLQETLATVNSKDARRGNLKKNSQNNTDIFCPSMSTMTTTTTTAISPISTSPAHISMPLVTIHGSVEESMDYIDIKQESMDVESSSSSSNNCTDPIGRCDFQIGEPYSLKKRSVTVDNDQIADKLEIPIVSMSANKAKQLSKPEGSGKNNQANDNYKIASNGKMSENRKKIARIMSSYYDLCNKSKKNNKLHKKNKKAKKTQPENVSTENKKQADKSNIIFERRISKREKKGVINQKNILPDNISNSDVIKDVTSEELSLKVKSEDWHQSFLKVCMQSIEKDSNDQTEQDSKQINSLNTKDIDSSDKRVKNVCKSNKITSRDVSPVEQRANVKKSPVKSARKSSPQKSPNSVQKGPVKESPQNHPKNIINKLSPKNGNCETVDQELSSNNIENKVNSEEAKVPEISNSVKDIFSKMVHDAVVMETTNCKLSSHKRTKKIVDNKVKSEELSLPVNLNTESINDEAVKQSNLCVELSSSISDEENFFVGFTEDMYVGSPVPGDGSPAPVDGSPAVGSPAPGDATHVDVGCTENGASISDDAVTSESVGDSSVLKKNIVAANELNNVSKITTDEDSKHDLPNGDSKHYSNFEKGVRNDKPQSEEHQPLENCEQQKQQQQERQCSTRHQLHLNLRDPCAASSSIITKNTNCNSSNKLQPSIASTEIDGTEVAVPKSEAALTTSEVAVTTAVADITEATAMTVSKESFFQPPDVPGLDLFANSLGLTPRRLLSNSPITPPFAMSRGGAATELVFSTLTPPPTAADRLSGEPEPTLKEGNGKWKSMQQENHSISNSLDCVELNNAKMGFPSPLSPLLSSPISACSSPIPAPSNSLRIDMMLSTGRVVPTTVAISHLTESSPIVSSSNVVDKRDALSDDNFVDNSHSHQNPMLLLKSRLVKETKMDSIVTATSDNLAMRGEGQQLMGVGKGTENENLAEDYCKSGDLGSLETDNCLFSEENSPNKLCIDGYDSKGVRLVTGDENASGEHDRESLNTCEELPPKRRKIDIGL